MYGTRTVSAVHTEKMAEGGSPGPALNQGPPDLIPDIIPVDLGKKYGHKHGQNNYKKRHKTLNVVFTGV